MSWTWPRPAARSTGRRRAGSTACRRRTGRSPEWSRPPFGMFAPAAMKPLPVRFSTVICVASPRFGRPSGRGERPRPAVGAGPDHQGRADGGPGARSPRDEAGRVPRQGESRQPGWSPRPSCRTGRCPARRRTGPGGQAGRTRRRPLRSRRQNSPPGPGTDDAAGTSRQVRSLGAQPGQDGGRVGRGGRGAAARGVRHHGAGHAEGEDRGSRRPPGASGSACGQPGQAAGGAATMAAMATMAAPGDVVSRAGGEFESQPAGRPRWSPGRPGWPGRRSRVRENRGVSGNVPVPTGDGQALKRGRPRGLREA